MCLLRIGPHGVPRSFESRERAWCLCAPAMVLIAWPGSWKPKVSRRRPSTAIGARPSGTGRWPPLRVERCGRWWLLTWRHEVSMSTMSTASFTTTHQQTRRTMSIVRVAPPGLARLGRSLPWLRHNNEARSKTCGAASTFPHNSWARCRRRRCTLEWSTERPGTGGLSNLLEVDPPNLIGDVHKVAKDDRPQSGEGERPTFPSIMMQGTAARFQRDCQPDPRQTLVTEARTRALAKPSAQKGWSSALRVYERPDN